MRNRTGAAAVAAPTLGRCGSVDTYRSIHVSGLAAAWRCLVASGFGMLTACSYSSTGQPQNGE